MAEGESQIIEDDEAESILCVVREGTPCDWIFT
jgi:hypothetical protein